MSQEPLWQMLNSLKALLEFIPSNPLGRSRLAECIEQRRRVIERTQFPDADASNGGGDEQSWNELVRPIPYPEREINGAIDVARPLLVRLLSTMSFDRVTKARLLRELNREGSFLEPDNRGSIEAVASLHELIDQHIQRTGDEAGAEEWARRQLRLSPEMERNNSRLEALAAFMDRLRDNPFVLLRQVAVAVGELAVPPDVLSVNPRSDEVIFHGTAYPVGHDVCRFVELLLEANGELVSTGDLKSALPNSDAKQIVPRRLIAELPEGLRKAIVTVPRKGTRLDIDGLMSQL